MKFFTSSHKESRKRKNKAHSAPNSRKSNSFTIPLGFIDGTRGDPRLSARQALNYYDQSAPVSIAVDWVNDEFKNLSLVMQDSIGDITKESPLLDFLKRPNVDMTQEDFLENLGANYLLANEVFLVATGDVTREPAEVIIVQADEVTTFMGKDGFLSKIDIRIPSGKVSFLRDNLTFRFYNEGRTLEAWQIKGFSPGSGAYTTSGRSRTKLHSIKIEIEQYIAIATNNLSVLNKGMRPSGSLESDDTITDEQFEALTEQITKYYSNPANAANVLILDNGMKFVPLSQSAKDMDFKDLTRHVTIIVFNRFKVPLPLVTPENMTLANMEIATLNLYDNAVLPLSSRMFRELTNFLGPRFKEPETSVIVADLGQISALQIRRNQELKLKSELNILSTNEMRNEIGREPVNGGDPIYIPSTLIPIGTVAVEPIEPETSVTASANFNLERKEFIGVMRGQKDKLGVMQFTDEELIQIADQEGLK